MESARAYLAILDGKMVTAPAEEIENNVLEGMLYLKGSVLVVKKASYRGEGGGNNGTKSRERTKQVGRQWNS